MPDDGQALAESRLVVSRGQIERITGTSLSTIDYWTNTGLVRPTTNARITAIRVIRQYDFVDVMALLVIQQLRERNVSLQHIRVIVEKLRMDGFGRPLTEVHYATVGKRVFLQYPGGEWADGKRPAEYVMPEVLPLEPLRAVVRARTRRSPDSIGQVEKRRGALGSKQLIAGTRIPVATVHRYLDAGRTEQEILSAFPVLRPEDVDAVRRVFVA
ncbi:MAG: MerR family transcriptional regulator [Nakamurella sp.]